MLSDADGETKRLHNTLGVAQDVEHLAQLLTETFGRTKRELKVCETNEIYCLDGVRKRGDDRAPAMQAMLDTEYGTAARKAFQEHFGSDEPKAKKVIRTECVGVMLFQNRKIRPEVPPVWPILPLSDPKLA